MINIVFGINVIVKGCTRCTEKKKVKKRKSKKEPKITIGDLMVEDALPEGFELDEVQQSLKDFVDAEEPDIAALQADFKN